MATKFYLAEIPDDFPATNVKFENMTKPLLAIPAKMVDGKPITIVGYINAGQKKYKANDCNGVQREHNKKLNNGLPILHKVPPKRDYGRYFCIMAEKGGTSHGA